VKAVVDRFENGYAVVLLGDEEIELTVAREFLPQEAGEGSWLKVRFELDREETEKQEARVRELLGKLQKKNSGLK
jgi:hypothetical protein